MKNQKVFYKLVRPDYTSFHEKTFKWPVRGIVEVKGATANGACGNGLHLALSIDSALRYVSFPFRILKVRPLSSILGSDNTKIRVAKAQSLGEIKPPKWAIRTENYIKKIESDVKTVPWFRGNNHTKAKELVKKHFNRLEVFHPQISLNPEVNIIAASTAWSAAESAAWSTARNAARNAAERAARSAARSAAESAARSAAESAAEEALAPTIKQLQQSAYDLVMRMLEVRS